MSNPCNHYLPLIHQYLDDELTREERDSLLAHLDSCGHCRNLLEDYRRIAGELRALPADIPPTLHRDIMAHVRQGGPAPWWRRPIIRRAAAAAACAAALALVYFGPLRPQTGEVGTTAAQMRIMADAPTTAPALADGEQLQQFSLEVTPQGTAEDQKEAEAPAYSYYPLMERLVGLMVGDGYEADDAKYILTEAERNALWPLLQMERWEVATDLPAAGFSAEFYLIEADQIWYFNQYGDAKTLVVPSYSDETGEKVCYFAPAGVIRDVLAYISALSDS